MRTRSAASSTGRSRKARTGWFPIGTTGESPTLNFDEHKRVDRDHRRGCARTCARHRRHGLELDRRSHRAFRSTRRRPARTACSSSRPTTTSRRRKGSISTSRRSTTRSAFRSSSTTFPAARSSTCRSPQWRACSSSRTSTGVKDATANLARVLAAARWPWGRISCSFRARTRRRWASWRTAAMAASRWPRTWLRVFAPISRTPASRATTRLRLSCRTG